MFSLNLGSVWLIQLYTKFEPSAMSVTGRKVQCGGGGGGGWSKATLVFISGPNLKTGILAWL